MKKIFLFICSLIFLNTSLINSYNIPSTTEKQTSTESPQKETNLPLSYLYYKNYPWELLRQKLVTEPKEQNLSLGGWQWTLVIISDIAFANISMLGIKEILKLYRRDLSTNQEIMLPFAFGIISTIFFHKLIYKKLSNYNSLSPEEIDEKAFQGLLYILDHYNPDLTKMETNNTKYYIPQELYQTFDTLWEIHQKNNNALRDEWGYIKNSLISKLKKN